ncbi:MAG: alpha-mannosidase [Candidatus Merdivicinus sp.]|jgi:alpha-mannosidase
MNFTKATIIKRKLANLTALIFEDTLEIPVWETRHATFLGNDGYTEAIADAPVRIGDRWSCCDDFTRWFTADVTVPESFSGKLLALNLEFGGEAIVRVNGEIISAITSYLEPNGATRTRVILAESAAAGAAYHVEIEAHLNYMEFNRFRRQGKTSIEYIIRSAALVTINPQVESYYFDIQTALDAMETLKNPLEKVMKSGAVLPREIVSLFESCSKDSYYYEKVTDAVVSSLTCVDFDFEKEEILKTIPHAAAVFQQKMAEISGQTHGIIKFVGQAHIDTAWLWPVRESIRKSAKTLSNVCALMDKYPGFTFAFSQPQLFEFVKDHYPKLYERVKEKVRSGQFELVGNTWVEMDTNIPSGESLIRQILYGRQYFINEFGKCSNVFWMPDVFGYSWALPQIIKRSGMKYFFTSKLINNDDNRFPYSLFQWQGIDGTRIPAYLQRLNYNGMVAPETLQTLYQRYDQKAILDEALMTFGYGDGGGGPTYQMLETAERLKDFPGLPKLEMTTSESYFKDADAVLSELPVWNDEMYYEFHRGTYTSQANVKKNNRKAELLYRQAEMASVLASAETGAAYPYDDIRKGYKKLLTNQFHDIMPGSSIHSVYVDAEKDYREIHAIGNSILETAARGLCGKIPHAANSVVVFNFLSWERSGLVSIDLADTVFSDAEHLQVKDSHNRIRPSHIEKTRNSTILTFDAVLTPMAYEVFTLSEAAAPEAAAVTVTTEKMENRFYSIAFDSDANLVSIYDKRSQREVLASRSNLIKIFEDKPGGETAWNIDLEYQNKEWILDRADSVEVVECSAIRGVLRVKRSFHLSTITQDIILYAGSDRIDFATAVDWNETEKMMKAEFTADVLASKATYEIQFGAIERPTHYNTAHDRTKFEVSAHKWADLSEGNYGVTLLNDCKYGYDIKENRMRITLLRSPIDPDPTADKGHHEFVYSLRPHAGSWVASKAVQAGYELNVPLWPLFCADAQEKGSLPKALSYFTCSHSNVILDTVKCAEDCSGIIVRFYESSGTKTNVQLQTALPFSRVSECNLVEEEEQNIPAKGNSFAFTIKPFEIKTFKLSQ